MRKLFFTLTLALTAIVGSAQINHEVLIPNPNGFPVKQDNPVIPLKTKETMAVSCTGRSGILTNDVHSRGGGGTPVKPEGTYTLRCKLEYDAQLYRPFAYVYAYNNEYNARGEWDFENDNVDVWLMPGTYDLLCEFVILDEQTLYGNKGYATVILEDVEVNEDSTIEINAASATNHLHFVPILSSGEEVSYYTYRLKDEYAEEVEVLDYGNCLLSYYNKAIYRDDLGLVMYEYGNALCNIEPSPWQGLWRPDWLMDWYVSDVSDKYNFIDQIFLEKADGSFESVYITAKGCDDKKEYSNDPKLFYSPIELGFNALPDAEKTPIEIDYPYVIESGLSFEDAGRIQIFSFNAKNKDNLYNILFCRPSELVKEVLPIYRYGLNGYKDIFKEEIFDGYFWEEEKTLSALTPFLNMSQYPITNSMNNIDSYLISQPGIFKEYNINQGLSFNLDATDVDFCETAPSCFLGAYEYGYEGMDNWIEYQLQYQGQMGETLWVPMDNTPEITPIDGNQRHLHFKAHNDNFNAGVNRGCLEIEADFNFDVDQVAPVVTGMQCCNSKGIVTDKFNSAEDGKLLLTAGGFKQTNIRYNQYGGMIWDTEYQEAKVTVSYAPHGSNQFVELESEDTQSEPQNEFGRLYAFDLAQICQESADGWYDIRITVSTAEGNYSTQTISPVLYIGQTTSVSLPEASADGTTHYYNLQGVELTTPSKGLNIIRKSDGSVCKVMIK